MKISDLPLKWKFAAGFAAVAAVTLTLCAVVLVNIYSIQSAISVRAHHVDVRNTARSAMSALVEQQNAVRGYVATGDASFLKKIDDAQTQFDADAKHLGELAATEPDLKDKVDAVIAAAAQVRQQENDQIAQRQNPVTAAQAQASLLTTGRLTAARADMTAIIDPEVAASDAATAAQTRAVTIANVMTAACAILCLALSTAIGWLLNRMIGAPIDAMTATMRKLASGDNSVVIPALDRKDEVGSMARAVLIFKDNAQDKIRLEAERIQQDQAAEAARKQAEAQVLAQERAIVVGAVGESMSALARGDLTYRMPDTLPAEYAQLRGDFNAAVSALQNTVSAIMGSTGGVSSGADEIAGASDDLSRRTEQQAASLEQTAAALDQITATVKRSADGARKATEAAGRAKADVVRSGQVMSEAVAAMSEIEQSSDRITNIISVIDEIAFQTNLLALNAGVEAARAGDSGRGFAVVAQEVRALAQRSAGAAKEIKSLIASSSEQVARGVRLVGDTGDSLGGIAASFTEIDLLIAEIAKSSQEQATGLSQVNTAINQMDQVTQQNAAMVEEATAAASSLKSESLELAHLVGQFDVGGGAVAAARGAPRSVRRAA